MRLLRAVKILLRRFNSHRANTIIMFAGLTVSFAFMMVITQYVRNELSYDTFWKDADNIYRVQAKITYPGQPESDHAGSFYPLVHLLRNNFPEVGKVARVEQIPSTFSYGEILFKETVSQVGPDFFEIFDLEMLEGNTDEILTDKRTIILSEATAKRAFGEAMAIGKIFSLDPVSDKGPDDYKVVGVFKDIPQNSHLKLSALRLLDESDVEDYILSNWRAALVYTYVKLKEGAKPSDIEERLPELERQVIKPRGSWDIAESVELKFHALKRLHLFQNGKDDFKPSGSLKTVSVYALSGLLLVLIAGTNFVNTTIVQAQFRIKEIALRKIYGAGGRGVVSQFLPETFAVTVIAFYLSVIGLEFWGDSLFDLIGYQGDTSWPAMLGSGTMVFAFALLLAFFAGAYPAYKLVYTAPLESLRTRNAALALSMRFSKFMMSFQFIIVLAIAVVGGTIWAQINYMQDKDLGYDPAGVLVLMSVPNDPAQKAEIYNRFSNISGVSSATRSMGVPTDELFPTAGFSREGTDRASEFIFPAQFIDENFFEVFKNKLVAGRIFSSEFAEDTYSGDRGFNIIVNKSMVRKLGFSNAEEVLNERLWWGGENQYFLTIVGVVEDVHQVSMRTTIEPFVFMHGPDFFFSNSFRIQPGQEQAVQKAMQDIWAEVVPGQVFEGEFLEDRLRAQYAPEYQLMDFIFVSGILSILISCLGLYAMSSFLLTRQQKEFAIRKVLGASFSQTSQLAILRAIRPAIIAIFFACPIAYFYLSDWLDSFAYRIDMPYSVYLAAVVAVVIVAIMSVYIVAYKTSRVRMAELLAEE